MDTRGTSKEFTNSSIQKSVKSSNCNIKTKLESGLKMTVRPGCFVKVRDNQLSK